MNRFLCVFIRGSVLPSVGATPENNAHGWQGRRTDLTEKPDEQGFESIPRLQLATIEPVPGEPMIEDPTQAWKWVNGNRQH